MNDFESEIPLSDNAFVIGVIYNLKKGIMSSIPDAEAEYDSIDTVHAIKVALEKRGHRVVLLEADETLPEKLRQIHLDIAFNIAEGHNGRGREGQIPAILNFFNIPFTGSDETTLCLALDKALTKRLVSSCHIRTPKYALFNSENPYHPVSLKYPVILKPNAEGSSKGISDVSVVNTSRELRNLIKRNLYLYSGSMLAEEYIEGREFTVGLLGNGNEVRVFPPMEIIYKKGTQDKYHVYSYNVKQNYKEYVSYECPASLTREKEAEMCNTAKKIFNILGCRDFSRIDFRMSEDGKIYFIEINPLPGLAPGYSDYPMIAESSGICYTELVNGILDAAIKRTGLKAGERS